MWVLLPVATLPEGNFLSPIVLPGSRRLRFQLRLSLLGGIWKPLRHQWTQNVELVLLPVPRCKGLRIARLVETSNDESPTQNEYSGNPHAIQAGRHAAIRIHYGLSINTLRGVPVALFLTNRSKLRSSYIVKTKASRKRLCPWCHPHPVCSTLKVSIWAGTSAKVRN